MKLLRNGKPCEIDDPDFDIVPWFIRSTRGPDDDEFGYTTKPVSDERLAYLLDYFDNVEVGK